MRLLIAGSLVRVQLGEPERNPNAAAFGFFVFFCSGKSRLCKLSVCIRMLIRHRLFVFSSVAHRLEAPVLHCKKCLHREGEYDKIDALANEEYDVFISCVCANSGH